MEAQENTLDKNIFEQMVFADKANKPSKEIQLYHSETV
jgi:hypothetical protein